MVDPKRFGRTNINSGSEKVWLTQLCTKDPIRYPKEEATMETRYSVYRACSGTLGGQSSRDINDGHARWMNPESLTP